MENKEFLETLKFGIGDGNLQYYLYNWRCPSIPPNKVWLIIYVISLCIVTPTQVKENLKWELWEP
jgi:hypothetical protein